MPDRRKTAMTTTLFYKTILLGAAFFLFAPRADGQKSLATLVTDSSQPHQWTVIAGPEYKASSWKQFWWGANYRREWTTPVTIPLLNTDSAFGGLTPLYLGGGRQTKSLHLADARGRHYVLRMVNKTYTGALPPLAYGTLVEKIANDQTSTLHPYAAITVPPMASAAGVFHTHPKLYVVPASARLGEYTSLFANQLCLLEERPDETQTTNRDFGQPVDIDGSEQMVENVTLDNSWRVDQHAYVKTRLFDMLIGDWGRHIDNWRWSQFDSGKSEIYQPVPKDRDQLYARFEGVMMRVVKTAAGLKQLQSFGPTIKDITWYNYPAMDIDRRFTNGLSRQVWIDSATALQNHLTDAVIEQAVRLLPPAIFALSGEAIITAIKQRRADLVKYAETYYRFLATNVDIPGSAMHELFEVKRLSDEQTSVALYKINEKKEPEGGPFFHRVFNTSETQELRLYGIGGNDVYTVNGKVKEGITVRIIGGSGEDSVYDASRVNGRTRRTKIYDKQNTKLYAAGESKVRIRDTTYLYPFDEDYHYNYAARKIGPGLNPFYRLFIGYAFKKRVYGWREKPYKSDFQAGVNFSLFEKSLHPFVRYTRPQLFGAWNVQMTAGYDGARRLNYFGLGNDTKVLSDNRRFHWLRTENLYATAGISTPLHRFHHIYFTFFYEGVKVLPQDGRFISKGNGLIDPSTYQWKHFGGARFDYVYSRLNDPLVPTKGLAFSTTVSHTGNLQDKGRTFTTTGALVDLYQPLTKAFSLYIRSGAATLWGKPEFYQHNSIGGTITLRGYVRNRFFGRTVYYQQNELRFIKDVRSYLYNGKAGLIALYDFGKVWHPGETTNRWLYGIGGGVLVAPFQKFSLRVYYTFSPEDRVITCALGGSFDDGIRYCKHLNAFTPIDSQLAM
jgi:hypothetical protein